MIAFINLIDTNEIENLKTQVSYLNFYIYKFSKRLILTIKFLFIFKTQKKYLNSPFNFQLYL